MPRPRTLVATVLLAGIAAACGVGAAPAAATAHAPARTASTGAVPEALRSAAAIGGRYWGAVPCGGRIGFRAQRPVPTGLAADSDAWVTFDTPLGANDLTAPASSYTSCVIGLGRSRWPTAASMRADWDLLCTTVTHELGHLLGHVHDVAPGSVMAPVFSDLSSEPAGCRQARPGRPRG